MRARVKNYKGMRSSCFHDRIGPTKRCPGMCKLGFVAFFIVTRWPSQRVSWQLAASERFLGRMAPLAAGGQAACQTAPMAHPPGAQKGGQNKSIALEQTDYGPSEGSVGGP